MNENVMMNERKRERKKERKKGKEKSRICFFNAFFVFFLGYLTTKKKQEFQD